MKRYFITIALAIIMHTSISTGAVIDKELIKETFVEITYEINFKAETPNTWKARSIASRFNNPGNLRSVTTGSFRKFNSLTDGYKALLHDIECKQTGRSRYTDSTTTLNEFVHIYAPPFENNTIKYVRLVCNDLNIDKFTPISDISKVDLARAIIKIEDPVLYKQMFIEKIEIKTKYKYN